MNNGRFIYTSNIQTKEELIKLGFKMIKEDCGRFVFANQPLKNFDGKKFNEVVYTNMLTF